MVKTCQEYKFSGFGSFGCARIALPALCQVLLSYDERKALLTRDPLACAEGFQTLVLLTLRHLFGMRFCCKCPDCAQSDKACTDAFGSSATAMGGVFGQVDAIYGSLECQKSGNFHIHLQAFIQCFHQLRSLSESQGLKGQRFVEMPRRCTSYWGYVQRKVYCNKEASDNEKDEIEDAWPEFKNYTLMSSRPAYQLDDVMEPTTWRATYLPADVEGLQKRKQHHVHIPGPDGKRMPLKHCQDPKDPTKCKSGFPRT